MTSTTIYAILQNKPHNPHFLNRYWKFISSRVSSDGYTENHHICPKADDLFPEYKDLKLYPWNSVHLSAREHFIAHWLLWKAYPTFRSQFYAFFCFCTMKDSNKNLGREKLKINSKTYSILKETKSESMRGEKNYFYGKDLIGEKNYFHGKTHSEEYKKWASESRTGLTYDVLYGAERATITKRKQSLAKTGENNHFHGKTHTPETRKRMSDAAKRRYAKRSEML